MKKERAVVFCFTGNLTFAVASVVMDLQRWCRPWIDEVVCIHDGAVSLADQNRLAQILPMRFIRYECPIQDFSHFHPQTISYFTYMVFSKFECLRLLNDYKMVVFMDYDVVIPQGLDEVFAPCAVGVKMLIDGTVRSQLYPQFREMNLEDMDMEGKGMCASLFVLQDTLPNFMDMYQFVYELTQKHAPYLFGIEQFAFSVMLQKFKLDAVVPFASDVYSLHPSKAAEHPEAKILHAYGQPKFWNGFAHEQWNTNYQRWLKMGGTPYRTLGLLGKILRKGKRIFAQFRNSRP